MVVQGVEVVPVIIALLELVKRVGLPGRLVPIAALVLGITSGFVYLAPGNPAQAVLVGISAGLASVGLFSGVKNTLGR